MKIIENQEEAAQLKNFLFVSLISADNEEYPEEVKQEIIKRYDEHFIKDAPKMNWRYILEPLGEDAHKYVKLMEAV